MDQDVAQALCIVQVRHPLLQHHQHLVGPLQYAGNGTIDPARQVDDHLVIGLNEHLHQLLDTALRHLTEAQVVPRR